MNSSGSKPPPRARIIAFPASRRIGEIRRLADQVCRLSCERCQARLRLQFRVKAQALRVCGFSDLQIRYHVISFEAAPRAEVRRRFGPNGSEGAA
jgi:hypothetical protein